MNVFTVYDTNLTRIRLGSKRDGGYIIFDGLKYDHLLSGGIGGSIQFESDFIKKYNVMCDAFDHTISNLPQINNVIKLHRKAISSEETHESTNLKSFIQQHDNVFIQMDIEGWEWDRFLGTRRF